MNARNAVTRINTAMTTLENVIGEPVFDEWALVDKQPGGWKLMEYNGNRKQDFIAGFNEDLAALKDTLTPSSTHLGDYAFSHDGFGTGFDAHICVGNNKFLLLNNTEKSTGDITSNPKWKQAQIHFAELLEAFIADPVA